MPRRVRAYRQPRRPLDGRLALLPIDTRTVVSLDFERIRAAPFAAKLSTLAASSPDDEKRLAVFRERTGLDPVRQVDSVVVGFPEEARLHGEMGVVVRASASTNRDWSPTCATRCKRTGTTWWPSRTGAGRCGPRARTRRWPASSSTGARW